MLLNQTRFIYTRILEGAMSQDEEKVPFQQVEAMLDDFDRLVTFEIAQLAMRRVGYLVPEALETLYPTELALLVEELKLKDQFPDYSKPPEFHDATKRADALKAAFKHFYNAMEFLLQEHVRRNIDPEGALEALELLRNPPDELRGLFGL